MRLIDADKLKAKIRPAHEVDYCSTVLISDVKKIFHKQIDDAPTITYADLVPLGRWIEHLEIGYDGACNGISYHCSECREPYGDIEDMNYCPNCGAKMDGEKESE